MNVKDILSEAALFVFSNLLIVGVVLFIGFSLYVLIRIWRISRRIKKDKELELLKGFINNFAEDTVKAIIDKLDDIQDLTDEDKEKIKQFDTLLTEIENYPITIDNKHLYYSMLSTYCFLNGDYYSALERIKKAIILKPNDDKYHYNKGLSLLYLERYDEALTSLRQALTINNENADAHFAIAYVEDEKGNYRNAISHLNNVLNINEEYYVAEYNLACAHTKLREYDSAIEILKNIADKEGIRELAVTDEDLIDLREDERSRGQFRELFIEDRNH